MQKIQQKSQSSKRSLRKRKVSFSQILIMSIETLWGNKLRTGLTMLGVIIGIASVIAITSIGQGVQKQTEIRIQELGTNVMLVQAGAARTGGISQGDGSASTLTWEDAKAIAKQVPAAKLVTSYLQRGAIQVVRGNINIATILVGTDLNLPSIRNIKTKEGLYFNQSDLDAAKPVAFLGSTVREQLFKSGEKVIGADIRIRGKRYTVVGVAESKGTMGGQSMDDVIYIPLTNMSAQIVGNNALTGVAINGFWVEASDADQLESAQFQVTNILRLRHRIRPPILDD
jgi:putative ABC transport system permease protein